MTPLIFYVSVVLNKLKNDSNKVLSQNNVKCVFNLDFKSIDHIFNNYKFSSFQFTVEYVIDQFTNILNNCDIGFSFYLNVHFYNLILFKIFFVIQVNISVLSYTSIVYYLSSAYDNGLINCLLQCSNHGTCQMINSSFVCVCNSNYTGKSCQKDRRACSCNPCVNNGQCIDNLTDSSYKCQCAYSFYGSNCESQVNLCQNFTCSRNGYCDQTNNSPNCICFVNFLGDKCQYESNSFQVRKVFISIFTIIAIIIMVSFATFILCMDLTKYICSKKVDNKAKFKKPVKPVINNQRKAN